MQMRLGRSPREWFEAASWHARGLFATEANRRIGFRAKELLQPAEFEARRGMARELATELLPELRIDGYRSLAPEVLPELADVCRSGREILDGSSLDVGVANGNKKFSRFRLASDEQRAALVRVGLDRRLIAMAATQLGVLPVILEADYFCSFPVTGAFTKSQLWHCDDDAAEVLKVFIYCNDVTVDNGPLELLGPEISETVRQQVGYRYAGRRYRVSDETMANHTAERDLVTFIGPAGTTFAVDTVHCFHRGSRITVPDQARVIGMICYCPPNGTVLPRRLASRTAPLLEFSSQFPGELESAVLGRPVATRWI